ncbi:hypothetical protein [[Clostridium] polysaccharolyticum]|uniref:Uncharacterized protein n=1 Tax=[Clostridium] polysaccharolyticum TaxID=29364 RepID=A0A1H9Y9L8_9FIRM|nr:hypothetical protein [[Clostridium] polysaccharolyticum]SES65646.1 hypothetical protein SAMN04487772_101239 [[Clostridium] polysaccharolyticum]
MDIEKKVADLGRKWAELGVNNFCPWVLFVQKDPKNAEKLKKKL